MVLQKIEGCLELRLSPFLLFLCPPDACNFYYLVSSFCDPALIRSLNLGRAWFSLRHLFGWSTAVRGAWRAPQPHHKQEKDGLCREHSLCWHLNPSGSLSSVSIAFNGTGSEFKAKPFKLCSCVGVGAYSE